MTTEHILRAMASNYASGHIWDRLDRLACEQAADEIASLRAEASATGAEPSQDGKRWSAYVAGIIETYLQQSPAAEVREKAVAGIIERRLRFLAAPPQESKEYSRGWMEALQAVERDRERAKTSATGAEPAGWKLVPLEPTPEMAAAADEEKAHCERAGRLVLSSNVYRAMIAATPTSAPVQAEPDFRYILQKMVTWYATHGTLHADWVMGAAERALAASPPAQEPKP
jgi:hypothetical protein